MDALARRAGAQDVERTLRRTAEFLDDVRVDHRGLDMRVAEVLLNLTDVDAAEQQVSGKNVTERILTLPMNRPPRSFTTVTIPSTANP